MSLLSRILLLVVAFLAVCGIGYYAYSLSASTLYVPLGYTHQGAYTWSVSIEAPRPWFGTYMPSDISPVDTSISILSPASTTDTPSVPGVATPVYTRPPIGIHIEDFSGSITYNDTIQPGYRGVGISVDGYGDTTLQVQPTDIVSTPKNGDIVRILADVYNKNNTTYRLHQDIVYTYKNPAPYTNIRSTDDPKAHTYTVDMRGYSAGTLADISWYTVGYGGKDCIQTDVHTPRAGTVVAEVRNGVSISGTVHVDLPMEDYCLYATMNGQSIYVQTQDIQPLVLTGKTLDMLSPRLDMRSQIEISMSSDIYTDTGAIDSPEYLAHRGNMKIDFLKHFSIYPEVSVSPADIELTPTRAVITLPLLADTPYSIQVRDLQDIYGQVSSISFTTTPHITPYQDISLVQPYSIYPLSQDIALRAYILQTGTGTRQDTFPVSLCTTDLSTYSQLERIESEQDSAYTGKLADIQKKLLGNTGVCTTKNISIKPDQYVLPFTVDTLFPDRRTSGLYVLFFPDMNGRDIDKKNILTPVLFSRVDSHITMKISPKGKSIFWVTDISTGKPVSGADITIARNITKTHEDIYNEKTQKYEKKIYPLEEKSYGTGYVLGRTDTQGILSVDIEDTLHSDLYGATYADWWDGGGGTYNSYIIKSTKGDKLGYALSTWSDGIADWNFGFNTYDGAYTVPDILGYIHTDRRLYLPGETVHIQGILRSLKNGKLLPVDTSSTYTVVVTDTVGTEKLRASIRPNEYGSIYTFLAIGTGASMGEYYVQVLDNIGNQITNGSFQVEIFKNPTFALTVSTTTDIQNEYVPDIHTGVNTDTDRPWYDSIYTGSFTIDARVSGAYYNGAKLVNTPFTYRIYRSEYWDSTYWGECFYGCYYEPPVEFYTEGTGRIDTDGYGLVRVPVDFSSYFADYRYTIEVTAVDSSTTEQVSAAGSVVARLPTQYKQWGSSISILPTVPKKFVSTGEKVSISFGMQNGKNIPDFLDKKYRYDIVRTDYTTTYRDDIRGKKRPILSTTDVSVQSGSISGTSSGIVYTPTVPGEYHIYTTPAGYTGTDMREGIELYVYGTGTAKNPTIDDNKIRVYTEKIAYKLGDTARILVRLPYTGSHLLLTTEKGGIINTQVKTIDSNTFFHEFKIDETYMPNAYIGVVDIADRTATGDILPQYRVGYTEVVVDRSEKKGNIDITPDKSTYKNKDTVNLDIQMTDIYGAPLAGEVHIMVVDESLIALLGNIDLDILPRFYQKVSMTTHTALSMLGMEKNMYYSRKGTAGGSGGKGGGPLVSSRTVFQNTVYYNPSIRTDSTGKARISFPLSDSITDYRIIVIGNTMQSIFSVGQKTIQVRKDYVLEPKVPTVLRAGDTTTLGVNIFNATTDVSPAKLYIQVPQGMYVRTGTGLLVTTYSTDVLLQPKSKTYTEFQAYVGTGTDIYGKKDIVLSLEKGNIELDSITYSTSIVQNPILSTRSVRTLVAYSGAVSTGMTIDIPTSKNIDMTGSTVRISVSRTYLVGMEDIIKSLMTYPYGCVEQTISSTLPNALVIKFDTLLGLGVDREKAKQNILSGIQRLRKMQTPSGGFAYWEGSQEVNAHITPYVVRSLMVMRDLLDGTTVDIPADMISSGLAYLSGATADYTYADDMAERAWTLAYAGHSGAISAIDAIDTRSLSRHGWLAYGYALQYTKKLTPGVLSSISSQMATYTGETMYWDDTADQALYTRLLIDIGGHDAQVETYLQKLSRYDWRSYYHSTSQKTQAFLTFARHANRISRTAAADISMSIAGKKYTIDMTGQMIQSITIPLKDIGIGDIVFSGYVSAPLYIAVHTEIVPRDIYTAPAVSAGMTISRQIDHIDERLGTDTDGTYRSMSPVTDGILKKGDLYRMTLDARIDTKTARGYYTDVTIEDYIGGAYRPINPDFGTNNKALRQNTGLGDWNWGHIESLSDRLMVHAPYVWGEKVVYTYFFRPDTVGVYTLPPPTAYLMYRPDTMAYGVYTRVQVVGE